MPLRCSFSSLSQSGDDNLPRPDLSEHLWSLTSLGSLPPARICFKTLPQLSIQGPSDFSTVSSRSPSSPELPSFQQLPSIASGICSSVDTAIATCSSDYQCLDLLFTGISQTSVYSSAFIASSGTKVKSPQYSFSHGFLELASWANSLRNQIGDQISGSNSNWREGLVLQEKGKQCGRNKLYCSIGLSGREITSVEKRSLSQAKASLVSHNPNFQASLIDDQSISTVEASQKFSEQETHSEKVLPSAVKSAAFKTTKHLSAGVIAAIVSRTFVAPLERLKLEYMLGGAQRNVLEIIQIIIAKEGIRGFWRGNGVNLLRTAPFKSINFFCYDVYRKKLSEFTAKEEVTHLERLIAGAAAGISATLLCFPLDTIRTKMVAPGGEALGGVVGCFQHMLRTEGFFSLYKGLLPAVLSMAPSGAVFYGVYDILKTSYLQSPEGKESLKRRVALERERRKSEGKLQGDLEDEDENLGQLEMGPMRTLMYGAIAGICAETITYPFEVIRRQLQMQNAATKMGALATCQQLVQKGGFGALYAGLLPSTLQVLPSAALSYFVYESMKIVLKVP